MRSCNGSRADDDLFPGFGAVRELCILVFRHLDAFCSGLPIDRLEEDLVDHLTDCNVKIRSLDHLFCQISD